MTNKRDPAATMSNGHSDLQALKFSRSDGLEDPDPARRDPGVHCPDLWFKEEAACDPNVKAREGPPTDRRPYCPFKEGSRDARYLHEMYLKIIPGYKTLWNTAFDNCMEGKSLAQKRALGWDSRQQRFCSELESAKFYRHFRSFLPELLRRAPEQAEAEMADVGITSGGKAWSSMYVGKVQFEAEPTKGGSWVLARPLNDLSMNGDGEVIEHNHPDFGRVKAIYQHLGPDKVMRIITRMKWYKRAPRIYHETLRCPLVSTEAADDEQDIMYPASGIVPWSCIAMPLGGSATETQQVMLARSWSVLRHLGFPQQPHTYPYPALPPVVTDLEQDQHDEALADAEDDDYELESEPESDDSEASMEDEEVDLDEMINEF